MLSLQQILESDSLSTVVAKLNANFQSLMLSGGGPQGIPGEQGIPGLPGRIGAVGPTGPQGPTGTVVGIIPFGSTAGGSTGPTGEAGPWNSYSYDYLNNIIGTGSSFVGQIYIDHWNQGFWQYLDAPNGTSTYTDSPYSDVGPAGVPPSGTGYFAGSGWYFYSLNVTSGGGGGSDIWASDISTYLISTANGGAYEYGPASESASTLTVKNARFTSKYGTIWISSGNDGDGTTNETEAALNSPTIEEWGGFTAVSFAQPGRYNSGIDRIFFKESVDSVPFLSNITARAWQTASVPSDTPDPAIENTSYPDDGSGQFSVDFWIRPFYDTTIQLYTPLKFYTERRTDTVNYDQETLFSSLGLYSYSSKASTPISATQNVHKSIFSYSSRVSQNPDDYSAVITNPGDTYNITDMLFDVRRLSTSNQFICSMPSDLYYSSDYISGANFDEAAGAVPYTVTQGYISAINGQAVTASTDVDELNYGYLSDTPPTGTPASGFNTRSTWYGSAAMHSPSLWDTSFDSDPTSSTDTHYIDRYHRIAGMRERGRKTWNPSNNTYFLSELIFYTSQFDFTTATHTVTPSDIGMSSNGQNSLPLMYLSPFRNFGIGTFTQDDLGMFEPVARMHVNFTTGANDFTTYIQSTINGVSGAYAKYPTVTSKIAAFTDTKNSSVGRFSDLFMGFVAANSKEEANPYNTTGSPVNLPAISLLDIAIRREGWVPATNTQAPILRLGAAPKSNSTSSGNYQIGITASNLNTEFQLALSPLNPTSSTIGATASPVGVGVHNLYPQTRAHFFGKNLTNEGIKNAATYTGFTYGQPYSPGYSVLTGNSPTTNNLNPLPVYPASYTSANQISLDYLGSSYIYPAGIREYSYEVFGLAGATSTQGASGGSGSPNAANYPTFESVWPTRFATPWTWTDRNYSFPSTTGIGATAGIYKHGKYITVAPSIYTSSPAVTATGAWTNDGQAFVPSQYIGFNLIRELLNSGDSADNTRWKLGTDGYYNGGAAIMGSASGDLAFVNIESGRDGGFFYGEWEQQGLSTRDVVNNIKMYLSRHGDLGVGNRPGYDENAYSSQERDIDSGFVNYVRTQTDGNALVSLLNGTGTFGTGVTGNRPVGLVDYSGISGSFAETSTSSPASLINSLGTTGEHIRLEIAAEKAFGKNGRGTYKTGYGYPASSSLTITKASGVLQRYLVLKDWATYEAGANPVVSITLNTDFEGRISQVIFNAAPGSVPDDFDSGGGDYIALIFPHPNEFAAGSGTPLATGGFVPPVGAVAAAVDPNAGFLTDWSSIGDAGAGTVTYNAVNILEKNTIGGANLRLNNFVAGEGRGENSTEDIRAIRQKSPKLIFTFLEADSTVIPGTRATNTTEEIGGSSRPVSGNTSYRKVNTVIASAQNESSLREYWIPKADNSGGTFMVFTDHYGFKNKDGGFTNPIISTNRFYVEEVVTLEFVPQIAQGTGPLGITGPGGYTAQMTLWGSTGLTGRVPSAAAYVKYFNSQMGNTKYGVTGTKNNAFTTSEYGYALTPFKANLPVLGPFTTYTSQTASTGTFGMVGISGSLASGVTANRVAIVRNVDKYYSIPVDTTNYDNGWNSNNEITNSASGLRVQRINSDMVLVDFNITVAVVNPDMETGTPDDDTTPTNLIDFNSPRWTQYVRLTYMPASGENNDCDYFMKLYGNSLAMMSWSSYNQWYPGTAIANDPNIRVGDALTDTGGPNFTINQSWTNTGSSTLTWNGNFIDATFNNASTFTSNPHIGPLNYIFGNASYPPYTPLNTAGQSVNEKISPYFATNYITGNISALLNGDNATYTRCLDFSRYSGRAYSILGNDWLSRTRNCMWRLVPRIGNHYGDGQNIATGASIKNNSFTLEVMFDKPILHIDTPFLTYNFNKQASSSDEYVHPYQNLTMSGQAIIRYSDATNTVFDGGDVVLTTI